MTGFTTRTCLVVHWKSVLSHMWFWINIFIHTSTDFQCISITRQVYLFFNCTNTIGKNTFDKHLLTITKMYNPQCSTSRIQHVSKSSTSYLSMTNRKKKRWHIKMMWHMKRGAWVGYRFMTDGTLDPGSLHYCYDRRKRCTAVIGHILCCHCRCSNMSLVSISSGVWY